ncbi:hypothetical protein SAMN02745202_01728 [Segatella oulorum]|uniref:Uncharacterized protein n=1 Tax=Segatella oulorum TaxID=28136 RepID=A0A1T4Q8B9_9BACT|nr:hypothetical protein SAMN02745202_01728 [Segatella oulorum]
MVVMHLKKHLMVCLTLLKNRPLLLHHLLLNLLCQMGTKPL